MDATNALRYPHIARAVYETPWAILPSKLDEILAFVELKVAGGDVPAEQVAALTARTRSAYSVASSVAVVPLMGTLFPRANLMSEMSGGTSVTMFRAAFNQALNDDSVGAIVIEVDSPGGMVAGIPEMAEEIRAARGVKPIVAVANTIAASGAYWLASQADELVVTPSGQVGSIGVMMAHTDESEHWGSQGIKVNYIYTPQYKVEGNPYEPLSDEAREHYQGVVNELYGMFVSAVAKGRRAGVETVRSEFGEGRMVMAREAVRRGMADRVETMQQALARLSRTQKRVGARAGLDVGPASTDRRRRERWLHGAKTRRF